MSRNQAGIDENAVKSLLAVSSVDGQSIVVVWADPVTHALLVKIVGGGGGSITVTDGTTSITNVTEIDFTSGATVTDLGGGVAGVAITGGGGGSITPITISGTIDDSNVSFTASSTPTVLLINGATYQQTGGAITWSLAGLNITLSVPVGINGTIFGLGISGLSPLTATGTIDDSNEVFTFTSAPTFLIINGAMYQKTGGAITWSGTTTVTLSQPVGINGSIWGL